MERFGSQFTRILISSIRTVKTRNSFTRVMVRSIETVTIRSSTTRFIANSIQSKIIKGLFVGTLVIAGSSSSYITSIRRNRKLNKFLNNQTHQLCGYVSIAFTIGFFIGKYLSSKKSSCASITYISYVIKFLRQAGFLRIKKFIFLAEMFEVICRVLR